MVSSSMMLSTAVTLASASLPMCSLNGVFADGVCHCDAGWKGDSCAELDLAPASPSAHGHHDPVQPTWGGSAIFEDGHWHLIVGARAESKQEGKPWADDYPCNSKIVRAKSAGADAAGPYTIEETFTNRSTWEPMLARGPKHELVAFFYGNLSKPAPIGSLECVGGSSSLLSHSMYVSVSASGSVKGPWTLPQLVRGMENRLGGTVKVAGHGQIPKDPCSWRCANGNPGPAFHPNGTLYVLTRTNTCDSECSVKEHVALWRADDGWDGEWTLVVDEPIFGWGDATFETCFDSGDNCTLLEDPYLWIDERGWHALAHYQNNHEIHQKRGAYGWSLDGLSWALETLPRASNASAWAMNLAWNNGSVSKLSRRQRSSLIRDPTTGSFTHVLNGADFSDTSDGCHWNAGLSLIQPLRHKVPVVLV